MVMYEEGKLRIRKLMKRAENGDEINLGFFGGSITQGSLASDPSLCYAFRVFDWWRRTFPGVRPLTSELPGSGRTFCAIGRILSSWIFP